MNTPKTKQITFTNTYSDKQARPNKGDIVGLCCKNICNPSAFESWDKDVFTLNPESDQEVGQTGPTYQEPSGTQHTYYNFGNYRVVSVEDKPIKEGEWDVEERFTVKLRKVL